MRWRVAPAISICVSLVEHRTSSPCLGHAAYRAWKTSNYSFYDQMAYFLHDLGVIVEPDSREPWFMCEAHGLDDTHLTDTLRAVEVAVDLTLEHVAAEAAE